VRFTVSTLFHERPNDRSITIHADEDAARGALYARIAPEWDGIHCPDGAHCAIDWCIGAQRPLFSLTRDEVIDAYREHRRHTDRVIFDTHEFEIDVETAPGLGAVFGTDETAVAALAGLDDSTRDRIAIALATVADDNNRALVLTTLREIIGANIEMYDHLDIENDSAIGVLFSTYNPNDEGYRIHREAEVLFDNGTIDPTDFGDETADALHALYGFQDKDFTVAVDLRTSKFDGDSTPAQTIYDRLNAADLTMTPDEALRKLRWLADDATSSAEDPAKLATGFAKAWRALDIAMCAGVTPPERWHH